MVAIQEHGIATIQAHTEAKTITELANILDEDRTLSNEKSLKERFTIASTISCWANYLLCICFTPDKKVIIKTNINFYI
jgi:hypothetical protein